MDIFHNLFYVPIFNLLMYFYGLFSSNLGLAIIGVALVAKILTYPLTRKQVQSAKKNKEFQERSKDIKKKFKNDQEQLAKEMAKIQAEFLPGQLGGCLNLIVVIVLLIQVRNVIINLVNQGVHAFNSVAYSESMKLPEDSMKFTLPEGFAYGPHKLTYEVVATNGEKLTKEVAFGVAESDEKKQEVKDKIQEEFNNLSDEDKKKIEEQAAVERKTKIGVYIEQFASENVVVGSGKEIVAFLRPPSLQGIDYSQSKILLDGEALPADKVTTSAGEGLNFMFVGADLTLVATDIGFDNLGAVFPYIIIAVSVGVTQFFSSRIQSGFSTIPGKDEPKKDKDKKDKKSKSKEQDEPDFAEMMQSSTKSMMFVFPVITVMMSLGFFGGANIFPTGVSVFWTGQSAFVIIEQLIANRKEIITNLTKRINERRTNTENS